MGWDCSPASVLEPVPDCADAAVRADEEENAESWMDVFAGPSHTQSGEGKESEDASNNRVEENGSEGGIEIRWAHESLLPSAAEHTLVDLFGLEDLRE